MTIFHATSTPMIRQTAIFPLPDDPSFLKKQLLHWANGYAVAACLDSNDHTAGPYSSWDCLVAVGVIAELLVPVAGSAFPAWQAWQQRDPDWQFGTLAYDLKNEVERLSSGHFDGIEWPDLYFFQPEIVVGIRQGKAAVFSATDLPQAIWASIQRVSLPTENTLRQPAIPLRARFSKAEYIATVEAIQAHIVAGDTYELNLCQEFFAEGLDLNPVVAFGRLNALSQAPFSTYFRLKDKYLCCASPERFLKKAGAQLISQPIKGTRRRGETPELDAAICRELAASEKDCAENVMIVDLVRNDLARSCRPGSVQVEELCGVHTFATVHQMISTVSGTLRDERKGQEALRAAFPMGSMTGAPKVMTMKLIEQYERTRRGLYSGAVGYCTPDGDFDFNVVIRSILYNATTRYASVQVGGAIVYDSVPEQEYEECLVKAAAMLRVLGCVPAGSAADSA